MGRFKWLGWQEVSRPSTYTYWAFWRQGPNYKSHPLYTIHKRNMPDEERTPPSPILVTRWLLNGYCLVLGEEDGLPHQHRPWPLRSRYPSRFDSHKWNSPYPSILLSPYPIQSRLGMKKKRFLLSFNPPTSWTREGRAILESAKPRGFRVFRIVCTTPSATQNWSNNRQNRE